MAAGLLVLAPLPGRAVGLDTVSDPTFAQAIVGPGAAIEPLRAVLDVVAPISGKLLKVFPHAFVVVAADGRGVLVHLGIDTVQLKGEGFTLLAQQGDTVTAGDPIVSYDVPAIVAGGRDPIVPVIVLERQGEDISLSDAVAAGLQLAPGDAFLTVNR
ncbi:PTS glucose transporter subunit IIA [Cryobacterium sp. SO2]|uniref:PTS sugar transporter subunit IIA n=1 Tax=Cryobacterium sp. SO2 TaxID=1897060 RepID=UPI00223E0E7F|nr:PTS glucose transporter subunit IIA [Cryobacterium sp. SO2]WEO76853.1 PTS glucose transporter subunit IIA [Cryobacterium sp. SO2]